MDLSEAIRKRILNLLKENNITVSKLSTLSGISRTTLSKFLNAKRKYLRIDIIELVCEGLNIQLKDFFNDKLFDDIEIKD